MPEQVDLKKVEQLVLEALAVLGPYVPVTKIGVYGKQEYSYGVIAKVARELMRSGYVSSRRRRVNMSDKNRINFYSLTDTGVVYAMKELSWPDAK